MDLLQDPQEIDLADERWRIYGRSPVQPSHYISETANVINSVMTDGCKVYGHLENSVIAASAVIEEGATVIDSVLMPGARVKAGAHVEKAIIGIHSVVGENAIMKPDFEEGRDDYKDKLCSHGISVLQSNSELAAGAKINGNAMLTKEKEVSDPCVTAREPGTLLYEGA